MEIQSTLDSMSSLYEETKRRLDELTILYEMTKISQTALNTDQMIGEIIRVLYSYFNSEKLSVLLLDEATGLWVLHPSSIGFNPKDIEALNLKLGKGITGWVVEQGCPSGVNHVEKDLRLIRNRESILSEICVPLQADGKFLGVIHAQSRRENAYSQNDLRLFEKTGHHLASLIESARSEERYRTVVENALDGVLVMGDDYRLIYVNERLSNLLGCEKEVLIGIDFLSFLDERSQDLLKERDRLCREGEEVPSQFEISILRKNGESRIVEMNSTLIRDSQGNTNHIAFLKDITEKRKLEEQLLQSERLKAIGEMASGVAHDFNNALAIILGNTQLLLLNVKDKEQLDTLKIIEKVAKDSAQTVRRLQEFTRSKIQQDLYPMDIPNILKDAIEITRPRWKDAAQEKGICIDIVTQFEDVPRAVGNVSELREVITNLIFNAVEAMPEGGRIILKTFLRGEKVCVQVIDTGVGMTEEVRKKVFEPFFTTKPFTNTGLGLSMAYGIIKRFGGDIEVASTPGQGTVFTIFLQHATGVEKPKDSPFRIPSGREAKILVIDDEPHVREVLSRGLSAFNHRVTEAHSGEQGLKLFQQENFDLVLTDLGMPNLSGWEVCKTIKKFSPKTPVGMITGWGMELDEAKKRESGVDFIISKPFDLNKILHIVSESLAC